MIDDEPDLEPDIGPDARSRADARKNLARLDRALNRMARKKGGGRWRLVRNIALVMIFGPVLWVLIYRIAPAPHTILMLQRAFSGETITHTPVRLDEISPHLVRAVIAAEDAKFCRHNGFDVEAIQAALRSNQRAADAGRAKLRGGSTISQQTAKNLFLWPQRDWVRKGAEVYFTVLAEALWPKRVIMEQYLNAVEWGGGNFGAEAAARAYFNKSAKALTAAQAARLAAVLPSPNKWSVAKPGPYVRRRAGSIEARMWVLHNEGLDLCVLDAGAPGPARPRGARPPADLPPMPDPPPTIVEDEAPLVQAGPAPDFEAPDAALTEAGDEPEPEEPTPPADAPSSEMRGPLSISP